MTAIAINGARTVEPQMNSVFGELTLVEAPAGDKDLRSGGRHPVFLSGLFWAVSTVCNAQVH